MDPHYDSDSDSLSDMDEEDDVEDVSDYRYGGYHQVRLNEVFNKKYVVKEKLGWGHFSTVWLVEYTDQVTGATCNGAMKVVRSAQKYTETAKDEIEILRKISVNDPNMRYYCLHLIDSFQHRGLNGIHMCIVTQVGGSNLLSLIRLYHYRGIPLDITKEISKQVLIALNYLHTVCGLIHTDLKPENVLLNFIIDINHVKKRSMVPPAQNIQVMLADFGNANWVNERFTNDIQTRQYRCPEVMLGLHWGCPADIWSHACVIFELLTGDFLFSPKQTMQYSKVEDHFALFIELLGPLPKEMIDKSPVKRKYFTSDYVLKKIPNTHLKFWALNMVLTEKYKFPQTEATRIAELLLPMLRYNENERATAAQCLENKWFL
ncbi:dual specificity protein kinase lkH1, putative [Entamoeba invadens IP1]|uniref:non-specific serine/threonine protein kinase n=1 Tax=Entamoeba invadens IP1 TaxID=370355 RepID=A0A0A1U5V1_ENTIV|nr:dual specificity protein kinase lkH1, putative [Entamoeba invadens IP1]ELP87206.1 dual specificity protein kinase lkH1, putative [Entamoeba invadens IP1]|eukprot:XP_004253977.1 dual specificity protein kinase lkH1, putative [Entamoeba invadens IP1]